MNNKSELNLFFSTQVWTSIIENYKDVNSKMLNYIKKLQTNNPLGISKSNLLGWHSENFDLNDNIIKYFLDAISANINNAIQDMGWDPKKNKLQITSMWSIINKKDASNSRHIHSNNYISAAYYVKAPENCGDIIFYDPREANVIRKPNILEPNKLNANIMNISPKEGLLVLFPSYLHHSVDFNKSNDERVVISFNINLT